MLDAGTIHGTVLDANLCVEREIRDLAGMYTKRLQEKIRLRAEEMEQDDLSHHMIYRLLGVDEDEGRAIDLYQNKGRFLYNSAGLFLEKAVRLCFEAAHPDCEPLRVPNTMGSRPKTFQVDCLVEQRDAIEIKWRDATTDGDHVLKEHNRILAIRDAGYRPVRVMFFSPNREQARRIQDTLATLYAGIGGEYYRNEAAWDYVKDRTRIDLFGILRNVALSS